MDTIENNVSTPRSEGGPNLNPRPSYADVLPQLRDNAQSAQRREKKPSSSHLTSSNNLNVVRRLLSLETARANAAEARLAKDSRNSEAILTQVLNIREAHFQAQAELLRVNAELRTYKFQLDLAHKGPASLVLVTFYSLICPEIRRAQIIADEADKARIKAEERCARDRENIRELLLQRAIKEAREQGRRDGWALGLERGRLNVLAMRHDQRSGNAEGTMVNQREERGRSPIPSRQVSIYTTTFRSSAFSSRSELYRIPCSMSGQLCTTTTLIMLCPLKMQGVDMTPLPYRQCPRDQLVYPSLISSDRPLSKHQTIMNIYLVPSRGIIISTRLLTVNAIPRTELFARDQQ